MESAIVACLIGVALSAIPAMSQEVPEGMYGACYRVEETGKEPADTSTVYARRQDNNYDYIDVTGDDWPNLPLNVARFADYAPPGTVVPHGYYYKLRARKVYGDMIWESPWTDSLNYYDGAHYDRDLDMVFSGAGQK